MTTIRRTSGALPVAQVDTLTLGGTWLTGDTITCTINGKDITLTLGTTVTTTQIGLDLVDMWNGADANSDETRSETGDNVPEFAEITAAAASSTTVTFTGDTKGKPFTLSVTRVTASSGSVSSATTTSAAGPEFWTGADNWDNGEPVTAANEVTLIDLSSGSASGGTFTITVEGQTTAALNYNDDGPTTIQTAVEGLSSVGAGNMTVTGTDINTGYTLTAIGDLRYTNITVTANGASLTGSTPVLQVTTSTAGYAGDDVIIDIDTQIKYGLSQSSVVLNSLKLEGNFGDSTGQLGLYERNTDGTEYAEYRDQYLAISILTLTVNSDADLIRIDTGTVDCTCTAVKTGSGQNNQPAFLWKGVNSANALYVRGDSYVGIAYFGDDTATLPTLSIDQGGQVHIGTGATLTTVVSSGDTMESHSGITTLTCYAGDVSIEEGAITTLYGYGSTTISYNSTGALGTCYLSDGAQLDFSQDSRTKTVTNPIELQSSTCFVNDPNKVVSSLIVDANHQGGVSQVNWGQNVRLTRGTVA